jgi:hypothetical protein
MKYEIRIPTTGDSIFYFKKDFSHFDHDIRFLSKIDIEHHRFYEIRMDGKRINVAEALEICDDFGVV